MIEIGPNLANALMTVSIALVFCIYLYVIFKK